jgi:hypothetical protein
MLADRVIAVICLAGLFAFLAVSVIYIREFDLLMVFSITLALASYDFWRQLFGPKAEKNDNNRGS